MQRNSGEFIEIITNAQKYRRIHKIRVNPKNPDQTRDIKTKLWKSRPVHTNPMELNTNAQKFRDIHRNHNQCIEIQTDSYKSGPTLEIQTKP